MSTPAVFNLLCPFQVQWLRETAPLAIAEKSRRIGWTWTHALGVVLGRAEGRSDYYHSSVDDTASREFVTYCADWARMCNAVATVSDETEIIDEKEFRTKVLTFGNGRKIVAGSSNPTFLRSKGGEVGLDENAFHRDGRELYKAAHATAMFWGHPLRIWSTHNGPQSYFNQMIVQAKAGKLNAKVHTVTIHTAVEQGIVERIIMRKKRLADVPAPDAKARQEWLDELRSTCPDQETWNEEYECQPADNASSLLSYELIGLAMVEGLKLCESPLDLPREKGEYYAGYDVGRRHDFSVLWVAERIGDVLWTRMVHALDRQSFPTQQAMIDAVMANPRVRRICIDEQGIGAQLAEHAMRRYKSRAEGISLSAPVKASLGMALRDRFVDREIKIPGYVTWIDFDGTDPINRIINRRNLKPTRHRADWLREDLHKTKREVTSAGNVRLSAESDADGHADGFWAAALMVEAAGVKSVKSARVLASKPRGM